MTGFARFNKRWASLGAILEASDAQANAGFAFLGATPPSVELFNAIQQDNDDKDNNLFGWIAGVLTAAGITAADATPGQLLQAVLALTWKNSRVFSTSGTSSFTVPAVFTKYKVTVVGGGGGGSLCQAASIAGNASGAGGGAGGTAIGIYTLTPGSGITVTVGAGGTTQVNGSSSSFGGLASASGGSGALFQAGASSAGASGGVGTGGTILNTVGSAGSDGQSGPYIFPGNGGAGPWGGSGRGGNHGGTVGSAPGAGGGGAYDSGLSNALYSGGSGAPGIVIVEW